VTDWQRTVSGRTFLMSLPVLESRTRMHLFHLLRRLLDLVTRDEGQGMVEYALILVLIAVVVIVVLIILGNQVQNVFCNISGGLGA
jgi:pilus assembly protein Flp/PilA